jgi:hypothetical protein
MKYNEVQYNKHCITSTIIFVQNNIKIAGVHIERCNKNENKNKNQNKNERECNTKSNYNDNKEEKIKLNHKENRNEDNNLFEEYE